VYANTFVGVYVRFWTFSRGDTRLRGFWEDDAKGRFENYRDVGSDENFHDIQRALDSIKSMPVGPLPRGQSHFQIGASSFSMLPVAYSISASPALANVYEYPVNYASENLASSSLATISLTLPAAFPASMGSSPAALRDEDYVEVTLVKYGQDISGHLYRFKTRLGLLLEKLGSEFYTSTDPRGRPCMVYYGKTSKIYYWTASLEPKNEYVKIDIKKKKTRT